MQRRLLLAFIGQAIAPDAIGTPPLPLGEAATEEETGADNVEPVPEDQPQVAAEAVGHGGHGIGAAPSVR
jgi:hypothetical protein